MSFPVSYTWTQNLSVKVQKRGLGYRRRQSPPQDSRNNRWPLLWRPPPPTSVYPPPTPQFVALHIPLFFPPQCGFKQTAVVGISPLSIFLWCLPPPLHALTSDEKLNLFCQSSPNLVLSFTPAKILPTSSPQTPLHLLSSPRPCLSLYGAYCTPKTSSKHPTTTTIIISFNRLFSTTLHHQRLFHLLLPFVIFTTFSFVPSSLNQTALIFTTGIKALLTVISHKVVPIFNIIVGVFL